MASLSPILKQATPVVVDHALGSWIHGADGRAYLDFTTGIGVTSTGHCHPHVVAAAREQIGSVIHAQYTTVMHKPLLKLTQIWRALHARTPTGDPLYSGRVGNLQPWPPIIDMIGQAPLYSPTVFNFFKPDFAPPGEMRGAGMVGPEFQILTDTTSTALANMLFREVFCNYTASQRCWGADDPTTLQLNEDADAALAASNPAALVDRYDMLLMARQMSPFMRGVIVARLNQMQSGDYDNLGRARVQEALYLILTSPEYSIQK